MALDLQFDSQDVARATVTGRMNLDEMIEVVGKLYSDPRYQPPRRLLWDMLGGRAGLEANDVKALKEYVKKHRPAGRGRIAIVAKDDFSFGMSRMFELMTEGGDTKVHVFRAIEPAQDWLMEDF